jgi:hypothetical protein
MLARESGANETGRAKSVLPARREAGAAVDAPSNVPKPREMSIYLFMYVNLKVALQ